MSSSTIVSVPVTVTDTAVGANPTTTTLLFQKCRTLSHARQIHAHMIKTNLVTHPQSVAKLMHTFSQSSNPYEAISLYSHVLNCFPNMRGIEFSVPSVLKACAKSHAFEEGKQILGFVLKTHLWLDPFVANSLVRMCMEVGEVGLARSVFDKMPVRDLVSWNSLITGYVKFGEIKIAREMFEKMPQWDMVSCNAMIDGYGKHGMCGLAEEVFNAMSDKDVVSFTSMILGFVLDQRPGKGLSLFREMLSLGIRPDVPAIVSVLSAIADLGFVEEGKWIHSYISMNMIHHSSSFIGSALINMYAKCGQIENAYHVFRSICHRRNVGDWNSMISGLALHGLGHEAIKVFQDMERKDIKPDDITFIGLLSACNHGGLVDEGKFYFQTMQVKYEIVPKIEHYGCIIDLFGRAGRLEEALGIINDMPLEPDLLIWKAMLSGSVKHNNFEMGRMAALRAIELAPQDSSCYVLLANMYAKAGMWDEVTEVRSIMKKRGIRKVPGCSSILVDGKVHEFLMGKAMDMGYNQNVLSKLEEIVSKLKLEGYEPDLNQVLLDIEDHEKESRVTLHSEKMALAFGLSIIPRGNPIHIVKNLRICCDCHTFMQLVSKIYNRRIIVRDQNRFHHFSEGFCSCRNHWDDHEVCNASNMFHESDNGDFEEASARRCIPFHFPAMVIPIAIALMVIFLGLAYKALKPPPPKICGSVGGPLVTSPRVKLDDGRHLAYREFGVPKEEARYKIIVIHGFNSSKDMTLPISQELVEEHGIYFLFFDRAGYGESDPNPSRSVKSEAYDIQELADKLQIGHKFYVIGISLGAYAVWSCLKYIPHR
ncbi:hypothetical protein RIF29_27525 [Crotalaria pallida]|uniref:DYW domain-containing protein n=1 Tax=Crotalaria pallida TaxID=3830 RepID=A0AAN9I2F4_CROPI